MSGMEVSLQNNNTAVATDRQEETEINEETTFTEVDKDLGHTKIHEKGADYKSTENTSIVEPNKKMTSQGSREVSQKESSEISANKKVFKQEFSSSESFSSEEVEEYVIEG